MKNKSAVLWIFVAVLWIFPTMAVAGNIGKSVSDFGVAGNPKVVNTNPVDAASAGVASGKPIVVGWRGKSNLHRNGPFTYEAGVPKTGQTTSYAPGDDGDLQKGVDIPYPRFTDNSDGTVTDNLTGLIWLKDANADGVKKTWADALTYCNALESGDAGLTDGSVAGDWRLPNRFELESLINLAYYKPCISNTAGTGQWTTGDPFNNVQSDWYWSGSTFAYNTNTAWNVYMYGGYVTTSTSGKTDSRYVWPVRGGND